MVSSTIAILAVGAALCSAAMAFLSWKLNSQLSKPAISLMKVEVKADRRVARNRLQINITFFFKNVGRQRAKINEFRIGKIKLEGNGFEQKIVNPMENPLFSESTFNFPATFIVPVNPQITNATLERTLPRIIGKNAIIIALKESGKWTRFYTVYHGTGTLSQMNREEYDGIKERLPEEFKTD